MFEKYDRCVDLYLNNMKVNELSKNSVESYARTFRLYREHMASAGYGEASVEATVSFKLSRDVKVTTIALYLTHLSLLSEFAVNCGIYSEPFVLPSLMPPKKKVAAERRKPYEHVLDEADMLALINAPKPRKGHKAVTWEREKAEVTLLVQSGLRNSELRALTPNDLDWENGTIMARVTKGDKPRVVAFPAAARKAVQEYLDSGIRPKDVGDDEPLFGTFSEHGWRGFTRENLSDHVYNYTKKVLGEEKACRTHAARHCYASVLLDHNVPTEYISESMGHSSVATTKLYAVRFRKEAPSVGIASIFDSVTA